VKFFIQLLHNKKVNRSKEIEYDNKYKQNTQNFANIERTNIHVQAPI